MYINEQYHDLERLERVSHRFLGRDGASYETWEPVLREHLMDVYINGRLTMKLVCLPEYLTELVLGRMMTEGIISSAGDVEQIYVCEHGKRAKILLKEKKAAGSEDYVEMTPTCCTGNHILNDYFLSGREPEAVTPIHWEKDWVFQLADVFAEGMPLHSQTWATHSCFLAREGKLLFQCEDIGRHNALDKVIGYGLRNGIDLTKCIVYSSGRIPTDMVMKVIRAGIPLLASKASPTREAIELARQYHLTLVCAARRDRMKLFS